MFTRNQDLISCATDVSKCKWNENFRQPLKSFTNELCRVYRDEDFGCKITNQRNASTAARENNEVDKLYKEKLLIMLSIIACQSKKCCPCELHWNGHTEEICVFSEHSYLDDHFGLSLRKKRHSQIATAIPSFYIWCIKRQLKRKVISFSSALTLPQLPHPSLTSTRQPFRHSNI